ncbi:MAG: DUF177 domain-containing protein [Oscillospiraceae bacterium]|nr:DUF177 domain-containing protein [Oscillospiraceae bacterium]
MVIDLRRLYDNVGEKLEIDHSVDEKRLSEVKGYSFSVPFTVKGAAVNRAGIVMMDYTAEFTLNACCDRCLTEFDRDYSFDFEHILVRELSNSDDGDEYIITEHDKLDMDELVITDCLLQLPTKTLCKEDCLGLCPMCGTDLNNNECNCKG